ncbi:SRPBCC family protein [Actinomadura fibrosa]|uniref:SRPBCC family protein n=1 Tax=Actinomadura fibrosa TaxID=111802 RepID=A0ABW2XB65_9ACTN|nr:SRPBCC family protein [Actinomadura fibrosa]
MAVQRVDVRVSAKASPAAVYAALRDGSTWPDWSQVGTFELERPGEGEPEGVGAIRLWRNDRRTLREQIVELVPNRRFAYTLLSGLAIRGYRADVDIEPTEDGCTIRWHSSFRTKVPGMGGVYRKALREVTESNARRLAEYARTHS